MRKVMLTVVLLGCGGSGGGAPPDASIHVPPVDAGVAPPDAPAADAPPPVADASASPSADARPGPPDAGLGLVWDRGRWDQNTWQ